VAWPLLLPLFGSQLYSAAILYQLALVSYKKARLESQGRLFPALEGKKRSVRNLIEQQMETEVAEAAVAPTRRPSNSLFESESMIDLSNPNAIPLNVHQGDVSPVVPPRPRVAVETTTMDKAIFG
jgi:hypothetical protein